MMEEVDLPAGWTVVLMLQIVRAPSGMLAVISGNPKGLLVTANSLDELLHRVPAALSELRDAGMTMPRLDGVELLSCTLAQSPAVGGAGQ